MNDPKTIALERRQQGIRLSVLIRVHEAGLDELIRNRLIAADEVEDRVRVAQAVEHALGMWSDGLGSQITAQ